jgi:hypothetical protein
VNASAKHGCRRSSCDRRKPLVSDDTLILRAARRPRPIDCANADDNLG